MYQKVSVKLFIFRASSSLGARIGAGTGGGAGAVIGTSTGPNKNKNKNKILHDNSKFCSCANAGSCSGTGAGTGTSNCLTNNKTFHGNIGVNNFLEIFLATMPASKTNTTVTVQYAVLLYGTGIGPAPVQASISKKIKLSQ